MLTRNDFPNLTAVSARLAFHEDLTNQTPKPCKWNFTRQKLAKWLERMAPNLAANAAP